MSESDATPSHVSLDRWISTLADSQRELHRVVGALSDDRLEAPSYAADWSCAQVLSHLGAGADIFGHLLAAGLAGGDLPDAELYREIWAKWDARSPREQVTDALRANDEFIAALTALAPEARARWELPLYGVPGDLSYLVYLRLGEHAVHTWDVAVMFDGDAVVTAAAVELLTLRLAEFATRIARLPQRAFEALVVTEDPRHAFRLSVTPDTAQVIEVADRRHSAELPVLRESVMLPAEIWLRLVYGRMRPADRTRVRGDLAVVELLTGVFPGF